MGNALKSTEMASPMTTVEDLLLPIGEHGVGEDPRYGDDFNAVKFEIDRLSDTDYSTIVRLCRKILQEEAKDLRVAGYYLMAKVFTEGICGLFEGVELYFGLLSRYGDSCHPQRIIAKAQTIDWLNNEKLSVFVKKIDLSSDSERQSVVQLKQMIESLNKIIHNLYPEEMTVWTSLNPWLDKNLPSFESNRKVANNEDQESIHKTTPVSTEIDNPMAFSRTVDKLLDYLSKQGDIIRQIAVSRALKWSDSNLLENEEGITKISPPRKAVVLAVESVSNFDDKKLYELESYFMESGCLFYFDLQLKEIEVATAIGKSDVADILKSTLRRYVNQNPEIMYLSYNDGKPFASEQTKRWLKQEDVEGSVSTTMTQNNNDSEQATLLTQIVKEASTSGLNLAIEKISHIKVHDQLDSFRNDLAKIEVCINCGRPEIALPLAKHLDSKIETYRLSEWDKELTLMLWDKLLLILQSINTESESRKAEIDELKGKICATDLGFALSIF